MRRFKTTFKILLVAVVMLCAAGTPVIARPVASGNYARVERVEKKPKNFFLTWIKNWRSKLSRYAMAAS